MSEGRDPVAAVLDMLTRAAKDRNAGALRWPVLATPAEGAGADARMLVLRRFDRAARVLELHTDARAPKVAQLRADPRCALLFFDARAKVQLRVRGRASIHTADDVAEAAFHRAPEASLDDYRGAAPGAALTGDESRSGEARANFAALRIAMVEADWLKLSRSGHERWRIDFSTPAAGAVAIAP